jgi:hypothetical protein
MWTFLFFFAPRLFDPRSLAWWERGIKREENRENVLWKEDSGID